jgi:hypothetical protein
LTKGSTTRSFLGDDLLICPLGVVPHHCRLQALDRNGDLPTGRADPSRHMLREPAEYFPGGASLRTLMGGRHVRVELGG